MGRKGQIMGQLLGHGVRKAFKSKGDDSTLTRFVKVSKEEHPRKQRRQPRLPGFEPPYIGAGRTKFAKSVKRVEQLTNLLVTGHSNVKIGRDVRKAERHPNSLARARGFLQRRLCRLLAPDASAPRKSGALRIHRPAPDDTDWGRSLGDEPSVACPLHHPLFRWAIAGNVDREYRR